MRAWIATFVPDDVEHVLCDLSRYQILGNHLQDRGVLCRRNGTGNDSQVRFVQSAKILIVQPVSGRFCFSPLRQHRLEIIRCFLLGDEHGGIVGGQPHTHEPRFLLVGELGQRARNLVDPRLIQFQRQKIGIREVAVIMRFLLGAHRARFTSAGIEQPSLLPDPSA